MFFLSFDFLRCLKFFLLNSLCKDKLQFYIIGVDFTAHLYNVQCRL